MAVETVALGTGGPQVSRIGGQRDPGGPPGWRRSRRTRGEELAGLQLSRGADIIPLIGTKRRDRLAEALGSLELRLDPAELGALEAAVPPGEVAGDRYDAGSMAALDSERPAP